MFVEVVFYMLDMESPLEGGMLDPTERRHSYTAMLVRVYENCPKDIGA